IAPFLLCFNFNMQDLFSLMSLRNTGGKFTIKYYGDHGGSLMQATPSVGTVEYGFRALNIEKYPFKDALGGRNTA
ncbi:MAG: hypothetical protein IJG25_01095, partial [Thermoguttaceae bacterium]|nr:hypothetical protein [Thermoguttaceae bacterium]